MLNFYVKYNLQSSYLIKVSKLCFNRGPYQGNYNVPFYFLSSCNYSLQQLTIDKKNV